MTTATNKMMPNGLLLGYRQWGKSTFTSGKTYNDISFPISFTRDVYQIIVMDWNSEAITQAKNYVFTIVDSNVTLTGARIVTNEGTAGYYKALIIGV